MIMKKAIIYAVITVIAINIILYLAWSFIAWEVNPKCWDSLGRFCFVATALFFSFASGGAILTSNRHQ